MKIERLKENLSPHPKSTVRIKTMGNIIEVRYTLKKSQMPIQKLDKDFYCDLRTGEVLPFQHTETRAENKKSVSQSLARLRELINTNVTSTKRVLWITTTYREVMTDSKRMYEDFRKFNMRFQYYMQTHNFPRYEYICAVEPQARGAWHTHCLFIFPKKAPFVPKPDLESIWGHGFVSIQRLQSVDNVGAYLSAYLGDMELTEAMCTHSARGDLKVVEGMDESGKRESKAYVKGARLRMYPTGLKIFRKSRGILEPLVEECTNAEAMAKVGAAKLTYEKTVKISGDSDDVFNIINYRQFNRRAKEGAAKEEKEDCGRGETEKD